jgi:ParB family chromosome partitioning protein
VTEAARPSSRAEREQAAERLLGQQFGAPPRLLQGLVVERVQHVPIDRIRRNTTQPRKHFDAARIASLAEGIRAVGLRQPVELDQPDPEAEWYDLTYGERRLRAYELLAGRDPAPGFDPRDFTRIPALVRSIDAAMRPAIAIIENLHRVGLTPRETAEGLVALKATFGTWDAVARAVGLDVGRVKRMASLAGKVAIVGALDRGAITQNQAFALRSLRDPDLLEAAVDAVTGCDETTTRLVVRELAAEDEARPPAERVAAAMGRAVGTAPTPQSDEAAATVAEPGVGGAPATPGSPVEPDSAQVRPADTPLREVMRQRQVSRARFAEALQRTCEQTGIWPTPPARRSRSHTPTA